MTTNEFRAEYLKLHRALHRCWTHHVDGGYDKAKFRDLDSAINQFGRAVGPAFGIDGQSALIIPKE